MLQMKHGGSKNDCLKYLGNVHSLSAISKSIIANPLPNYRISSGLVISKS